MSKYQDWRRRYGQPSEHNAHVPLDGQLLHWERQAILDFHRDHPREGYRRLCYMMLDRDIVAVCPSSVYRMLRSHGLLRRWNRKPTSKGKGFAQPLRPHKHWHINNGPQFITKA